MTELKFKRLAAGISGVVLCAKTNISRSRLSLIERGCVHPDVDESARIHSALEELIRTKSVLDRVAASMGWPMGVGYGQ